MHGACIEYNESRRTACGRGGGAIYIMNRTSFTDYLTTRYGNRLIDWEIFNLRTVFYYFYYCSLQNHGTHQGAHELHKWGCGLRMGHGQALSLNTRKLLL